MGFGLLNNALLKSSSLIVISNKVRVNNSSENKIKVNAIKMDNCAQHIQSVGLDENKRFLFVRESTT